MADPRATRSSGAVPPSGAAVPTTPATGWLTPERVAHAEFRTSFRGLDPAEVRSFLARVAAELRTLFEAHDELKVQLDGVEERHRAPQDELDVHRVTELLGQETARVLETAREAASDIRANAAASASATLEAAEAEAERLRTEAAAVLDERTSEAQTAADAIRSEADTDAERTRAEAADALAAARSEIETMLADARAEAARVLDAARADADTERSAGRDEGRRMVAEAKAVRERILADMARRRNVARQQLERVRAARERLIEAIAAVKDTVDVAQSELSGSLVEAKLAGDRAARQVDIETIPSQRELESEVELAKDTGLVDLRGETFGDDGDDSEDTDDDGEGAVDARHDYSPIDTGEFEALTSERAPVPIGTGSQADDDVIDLTQVEDEEPGAPLKLAEPIGSGGGPVADERRPSKPPKSAGELFARLRAVPGDAAAGTLNGTNGHASGAGALTVIAGGPDEPTDGPAADLETDVTDAGGDRSPTAVPAGDRVELHKRDALVAGTVRDLSRQLKLTLSDQQNALLEAVQGRGGPKAVPGPLIPNAESLAEPFRPVALQHLAASAQLGWRAVSPDDVSAGEVDVAELSGELALALAAELHSRLERDDGTTEEDAHLAERVRSAYRELRSQRLGDLVAHAVLAAYGRGQLAAAADGTMARWIYDTCGPDCLDNALAGPIAFGQPFPTGHLHPPAFEGCRCLLVSAPVPGTASDDDATAEPAS